MERSNRRVPVPAVSYATIQSPKARIIRSAAWILWPGHVRTPVPPQHAFRHRHSENERSLSEFAKSVGYSKSVISRYVLAYKVVDRFRVATPQLYETARVAIKQLTSHFFESEPLFHRNMHCDRDSFGGCAGQE